MSEKEKIFIRANIVKMWHIEFCRVDINVL